MVLVYDGVCNVCDRWVQFLLPRDGSRIFRFAHCQSEYGRATLNRLGLSPDDPETVVLVDGDRLHLRSGAILRAMAALGGSWRAMLVFLAVPPVIRDWAYGHFARRRYRWFGRKDQCVVPDARWRDRFLP